MQIARDTVATLDFTLRGLDGKILDTSSGRQPMTYLHGRGSIVPGLEAAMEGKRAGDEVRLTLAPQDAFGLRNPQLLIPVPRKDFPIAELAVGMAFQVDTDTGPRIVRVAAIDGQSVTVDANHRWAGLTVIVEAKVLEVRPAKAEEIAHGHVCVGDHTCHMRQPELGT